ncbi:endonuclease/Exonuclease/phosphatase family protein [Brevibacillus laterosporus GI-9]|uniref:endonuclease/exonuclease/phosphatase family protein n=1 Tax=Brevibacillus laterosporus TaxID=1465 RepID=UPI0002404B39|nr:endonuclease/exonuclease/phosphatase family protein [Brevibacillus laterosporus]CCF13699.1 endonuclease/Exonuclease/phosphatase family protein [Brevibacillus laterosporus GI-9]
MRLLTLNCHSWQESNQQKKLEELADAIAEHAYDVIALQEVSQSIDAVLIKDQIKADNYAFLLLQELQKRGLNDYRMVWEFCHIGYEIYEEGVALLTNLPIIKQDAFYVSKHTDTSYWKTRKVIKATVEYHQKCISFFSCHFGWWEDEEEPFHAQFERFIKRTDNNELTFLMGDFNNHAKARGEGYDMVKGQGWYDTFLLAKVRDEGSTVQGKIAGWDRNQEGLRIDYIWVNQPVSIQESKVIFNGTNKPVISDHFGVDVLI